MSDQEVRRYLTREDAAMYVGFSTRTIDRAVKEGRLRSIGRGRTRRFLREWLDQWYENWAASEEAAEPEKERAVV